MHIGLRDLATSLTNDGQLYRFVFSSVRGHWWFPPTLALFTSPSEGTFRFVLEIKVLPPIRQTFAKLALYGACWRLFEIESIRKPVVLVSGFPIGS